MRRDGLKKVQRSEAIGSEMAPKAIVATRPNDPSITSFDFLLRQCDHAIFILIHVMEVVFVGRRKRVGWSLGLPGLIENRARLWSPVGPPCVNYEKNSEKHENYDQIYKFPARRTHSCAPVVPVQ